MKLEEQKEEKKIKGYHRQYLITTEGKIISLVWGYRRVLKQTNHKGYKRVSLQWKNKRKQYFVHRLVAEAFKPNPLKRPQVNHMDGDKSNNHASNLEWVTIAEQQKHKREILGWDEKGKKNGHYGYNIAKLYPSEELRNELVKAGLPRKYHNLAELGERLPKRILYKDYAPNLYIGRRTTKRYFRMQSYYMSDIKKSLRCWVIEYVYLGTKDDMRYQVLDITGRNTNTAVIFANTEANARAKMWLYLKKEKL